MNSLPPINPKVNVLSAPSVPAVACSRCPSIEQCSLCLKTSFSLVSSMFSPLLQGWGVGVPRLLLPSWLPSPQGAGVS